MTAEFDWLERSDWSARSPEFGGLRVLQIGGADVVAMEFAASGGGEAPDPAPLWETWRRMAAHCNVLEAVGDGWLRYAAIDWRRAPLVLDGDVAAAWLATWGAKLSWVGEHLLRAVPGDRLGWMASPIVRFDLEGELRVAFVAPERGARCAPEVIEQWPRCDERGLIFGLVRALLDLVVGEPAPTGALGEVIGRCLEPDPARRIATFQDVRDALRLAGGLRVAAPSSRSPRSTWQLLEEGIGYLAVDQPTRALRLFAAASGSGPHTEHAARLRDTAIARGGDFTVLAPGAFAHGMSWALGAPMLAALERAGGHERALALYQQLHAEPDEIAARHTAIARCQSRLGMFPDAIDEARRALRVAPADLEANRLALEALWRTDRDAEALATADAWLAAAPDEARAHHARGKSLLRLRRPLDARQALDRACLLGPALVEAMVLRREAVRMLGALRSAVGTAAAQTLAVPAHVPELRDLLAAGRLTEAIRVLQRAEHAADPEALVALGHLLAFGARFTEALDAFDAAARAGAGCAAQLGRGHALLELDRPAQALEAFDRLLADHPDLGDAREARALALKRLGRDAEAEAAFRHHLATVARGSALRVRTAEP